MKVIDKKLLKDMGGGCSFDKMSVSLTPRKRHHRITSRRAVRSQSAASEFR